MLDLPVIYSAVASSPCKILRISTQDFLDNVPTDVVKKIEDKLWEKMKYLRDRLM